jgi:hypothetical protein
MSLKDYCLKVGAAGCCCSTEDIRQMLAMGSPRLALAKALGVPMAPYAIRVAATFSTASQAAALDQGQDVKLIQDVIIDDIRYQVDNQNTGSGDFDYLNDYFFSLQSNFEATLKVTGAPRFDIYPNYTPIAQIRRPTCGWVLSNTQGIRMDFQSNVTLPFFPVKITFVFEGRTTHWAKLVEMSSGDALNALQALGCDTGVYTEIYC